MILTGRAKEDFENWYWNEWFSNKERNHYKNNIYEALRALTTTDKVFLHALIIEWFDSVGVYIEITRNEGYFEYFTDSYEWDYGFETRQESTKQAIIKANQIYNEKVTI